MQGDIWPPQIRTKFFWVEGLRRIPNCQVPRPNGFFLEPLEKSNFWGEILIIKKLAFEIKISQYTWDCQASFFIDVNLQGKELRKMVKFWWAVEGTTYRGRCKSLLYAEITLTFEAFLGCAPHHPRLVYAWYDSISMPDTIPLEIDVEWGGCECIGGAEVGQNTKVGVLGSRISQCASDLTQFSLSGSPISLLTPYIKMILGFSRIKHLETITMW